MKRTSYSAALVAMATIMLPIILVDVYAATVDKITPDHGKTGIPININGDAFKECGTESVPVLFGFSISEGKVKNDKHIQAHVPSDLTAGITYDVSFVCGADTIFAGTFTVTG